MDGDPEPQRRARVRSDLAPKPRRGLPGGAAGAGREPGGRASRAEPKRPDLQRDRPTLPSVGISNFLRACMARLVSFEY